MQTFIKLVLVAGCLLGVSSFARDGAGATGGGDPLLAKWVAGGHDVLQGLKASVGQNKVLTDAELTQFETALNETRLEATDQKLIDPEEGVVTALTDRDPLHPGKKYTRIDWQVEGDPRS